MTRLLLCAAAALALAGCDCLGLGCPDQTAGPSVYIDIDMDQDVNQPPGEDGPSGSRDDGLAFRCQLANCRTSATCSAVTCSWDDNELHDLALTASTGERWVTRCASPCVFDAEVSGGPRDVEATLEERGTVLAGPLGPFHTTS